MSRIGFSESMRQISVPSFLNGAARALDLGSTFDVYNESDSPRNADTFALASDWIQVGNDIAGALDQYVSP